MKKTTNSLLLIQILLLVFISSCKKDDQQVGVFAGNRVFIVNEGPFQNGSGSISVFDRDTKVVENEVFNSVNGWSLGGVVQSVYVDDILAFIVVNKANLVEVVDSRNFESRASIQVSQPRYLLVDGAKAYVSSWDNKVYILDLTNYEVSGEIEVGEGPDRMLLDGRKLFVLNIGGLQSDNKVSVINTETDQLIKNIEVGDNPSGITQDINGKIWVLCAGKGWNGFPNPDDTKGRLVQIDANTLEVVFSVDFPDSEHHPNQLTVNQDGNMLYYLYTDGVYKFPISNNALETKPLIPSAFMYYGLGFDKTASKIYVCDPLDYVQNGRIYRYAENGTSIDTLSAGIIPNGFFFN